MGTEWRKILRMNKKRNKKKTEFEKNKSGEWNERERETEYREEDKDRENGKDNRKNEIDTAEKKKWKMKWNKWIEMMVRVAF